MEPGPCKFCDHACVCWAKKRCETQTRILNMNLFVFLVPAKNSSLFSLILVDFSILVLHVFGNFQLFFISYENINKLSEKTVGLHSKSSKSNG